MSSYDVIVVGGGPAGLSAALVLGRCRRRVLLCDAGHPRNERSTAIHGFLSRDGVAPADFYRICREQLQPYGNVECRQVEVVAVEKGGALFGVTLADGSTAHARRILLATGIADELPELAGLDRFYGRSVHHCPYCDGWEHRDQPIAVIGGSEQAAELAIELLLWSADVVLCTDGPPQASPRCLESVRRNQVAVRTERVAALEGEGDRLAAVRFTNGSLLPRQAVFISPGQRQHSRLAESMGCGLNESGCIECESDGATCVEGVFAAGNARRGLQLVIIAAAEGTRAAFSLNQSLLAEEGRA